MNKDFVTELLEFTLVGLTLIKLFCISVSFSANEMK